MNIYQELGVGSFINVRAPYTRFGGAIMSAGVVDAMSEAARRGVILAELQEKVGQAIARLTNNEGAYVSCGASSGITLAVATCMAGVDETLSDRLPDTRGMKNVVIMHALDRGSECDVAIRCSGAGIVNIGDQSGASEGDLRAAISDQTAAVVALLGDHPRKIALARMVAIAHEHGVPMLLDGAGLGHPKENLWRYTRDAGADAVIISGGKALRGPQSTGLVLGTRAIVAGCAHHGVSNCRIGRGMKVGKEELAGIYAAVRIFIERDEAADHALHVRQADYLIERMRDITAVAARRSGPTRLELVYDESINGTSYAAAYAWFLRTEPGVLLSHSHAGLALNTEMLEEGEERVVADKLQRFFLNYEIPKRTGE